MEKVEIDPTIKAIAWDFDGTIVNSFHIVKELVTEIAEQEGLPVPTGESFLKNYHGTMRETIANLIGLDLSSDDIDRMHELFLQRQERYYEKIDAHLIEDALALLGQAKDAGLRQVLVTNRQHAGHGKASPHAIVAGSILKDHIDTVIAGDDGVYRKPDARVLDHYMRVNNLRPAEVLVIGDQFVDAQLAKNLGTKAILVSRDGRDIAHLQELGKDWHTYVSVVTSLHDVTI